MNNEQKENEINRWLENDVACLNSVKSLFVPSTSYERSFIKDFKREYRLNNKNIFTLCPTKKRIFESTNTPKAVISVTSATVMLFAFKSIRKLIESKNKHIILEGYILMLELGLGLRFSEAYGYTAVFNFINNDNLYSTCTLFGRKKKHIHLDAMDKSLEEEFYLGHDDVEDTFLEEKANFNDALNRVKNGNIDPIVLTSYSQHVSYQQPILFFTPDEIETAVKFVHEFQGKDKEKNAHRRNCVEIIKNDFGQDGSNGLLRKIYAVMTYHLFCNKAEESINFWISKVLGHENEMISLYYNNVIVSEITPSFGVSLKQDENLLFDLAHDHNPHKYNLSFNDDDLLKFNSLKNKLRTLSIEGKRTFKTCSKEKKKIQGAYYMAFILMYCKAIGVDGNLKTISYLLKDFNTNEFFWSQIYEHIK